MDANQDRRLSDRALADRTLADRHLADQLERMAAVLEERFGALDARLDAATRQLDTLDTRLDEFNRRLERWESLAALRLDGLERAQADQETRLRSASEAVTRLSTVTSLAQAGQAAFAVLLSAVAAYLARR